MAGAIPILRPLRESLAGDTVHRVLGIVNGTTNFILDRMDSSGADFGESLEEAQALGYAEADPTADVEGFDAAAKAAILAGLAFHTRVTAADVYREGITEVTAADIASAKLLGRIVKLLAICERHRRGGRGPRAPGDDPAHAPAGRRRRRLQRRLRRGEVGRAADVLRRGRGRHPHRLARCSATSSRSRATGWPAPGAPSVTTYADLPVLPMGDTLTRYHVSLDVADKPGVLAPVAEAFARHGVSIQAVRQTSRGADALLVIVTHEARDADLAATISELQALPVVRAVASVMRVEGEEDQ